MAKKESIMEEGLEARYERYKGILKDLTIMSDMFMRNVFKKQECTEYVLQTIMSRRDLKVIDQVLQKDYKNLQGRSAILDCVVRDSTGKQMDVEIQQDNEGVEFMCREMEQIYSEGMEKGIEEGIEKGELRKAKDTALSMALDGMKIDKIAQYLKINPKLVQEWIGEAAIE